MIRAPHPAMRPGAGLAALALLAAPAAAQETPDTPESIDEAEPHCGSIVPLVRVAPEFPERAEQAGVEAVCTMLYDIRPDGGTENICGVCASTLPDNFPAAVRAAAAQDFVDAAALSVGRWEYTPSAAMCRNAVTNVVFKFQDRLDPPQQAAETPGSDGAAASPFARPDLPEPPPPPDRRTCLTPNT